MTHVFISWSGKVGNKVATALSDWLPGVIQELTVFTSQSIPKGELWLTSIAGNLDSAAFGIVCVTQDSKTSPWLHYEAGALGQKVENRQKPKVATFLHKIDVATLGVPLSLGQATMGSDKQDILRLIQSINDVCANPLTETLLLQSFERNYPYLETALEGIPETDRDLKPGELKGTEPEGVVPDTTRLLQEIITRLDSMQRSDAVHDRVIGELIRRRELDTLGELRANALAAKRFPRTVLHKLDQELIDGRDAESYDHLLSLLEFSGFDFQIQVDRDGETAVVFKVDPYTDPRKLRKFMEDVREDLASALIEPPEVLEHDETRA